MHSPNEFPLSAQFFELKMGYEYSMAFNRMKIKYLEPPYETNCVNYNLDSINGYQMNIECLQHCIEQTMHKVCSPCKGTKFHQCCFITKSNVWPINWINKYNYGHLEYCKHERCFWTKRNSVMNKCKLQCQKECVSRYYIVNERSSTNLTTHRNWDKSTVIFIYDNKIPDQATEHTPDMTFIDFFGTFGGTVGIWLGLSVIALFDYLIKHFN